MIVSNEIIYDLHVYRHRIQRKRDVTTKSLITFDKIYLAVQRPRYYQEALKQKRNQKGTLRSKIRSCTTWCQFVLRNIIKLNCPLKTETGNPPISHLSYYIHKRICKKKEEPKLLYFNLFLNHVYTLKQ